MTSSNPDPNSNSESEQKTNLDIPSKPENKNFLHSIAQMAQGHPAVIALFLLLAGSFYGGIQFIQVQQDMSGSKLIKPKEVAEYENLKEENPTLKNTIKIKDEKIQELENLIKILTNCTGEIKGPENQQKVDGNIEVKGKVGQCADKRLWLILSPITTHTEKGKKIGRIEDKDCYVQGEITERDKDFNKGTTSIVKEQKYKVYLVSIPTSEQAINQKLIDAQKQTNPHISCSDINLAKNQLSMITVDNTKIEEKMEQTFSRATIATRYGGNWGGLQVFKDSAKKSITLNGSFSGAAGYAIENDPDLSSLGGTTLTFQVRGTGNSRFDQRKLFKLEVNGLAVQPTATHRVSSNDPEYITAQDGSVSFQLPDDVYKIELVFWNASLNNLQISATVSD